MNSHVGAITLGVRDLERAKRFYRDGLGWPVQVDQGHFVSFRPADGSSALSLYPREVLADDAGVAADGGEIVRPAQQARWGGYFGYFADPDGNLWKIVAGAGDQPYAE